MLTERGRAQVVDRGGVPMWCATEQLAVAAALDSDDRDEPAAPLVRGHLDVLGPVTVAQLASVTTLTESAVNIALARLEQEGFALRGQFDPTVDGEQWCARRLLVRIHGYTQKRLRREIEPVTAQDFMRFLLRWQHVAPGSQRRGRAGLVSVIEQLQGFELPAGTWEEAVLPARVEGYKREWLDSMCLSGELAWGRLSGRAESTTTTITSRATPVTLILRSDMDWLLQAARGEAQPVEPDVGATRDVLDALAERGALFVTEISRAAGRLPAEVETALWDAVARGLVTADGFSAVRALLASRVTSPRPSLPHQRRRGLRRGASGRTAGEGRWSLLPPAAPVEDGDLLAEAVAEQLLARWGVVFRDVVAREQLAL